MEDEKDSIPPPPFYGTDHKIMQHYQKLSQYGGITISHFQAYKNQTPCTVSAGPSSTNVSRTQNRPSWFTIRKLKSKENHAEFERKDLPRHRHGESLNNLANFMNGDRMSTDWW